MAQESPPLKPIVVRITDIHREDQLFRPLQREDGSALLFFLYKGKGKPEVDALRDEGLHTKRPVHIFDGTNFIAECRIAGEASSLKVNGDMLYGLVLRFDTFAGADRAADAMREKMEDYFRRKDNDRRTWY